MESWLLDKNIPFHSAMLKPELYKLICYHRETYKRYTTDRILAENNHTVLRLPPYDPDNPTEMVWKAIKTHVTKKNATWKMEILIQFVANKINGISKQEFNSFSQKVRNLEEEYRKSDVIIDNLTEEYTIRVGENESESEVKDSDSNEL
ncbi:unnamed protein product [Euphydryas editha]|uniref:Tc1-like transposase DDE domain-containing protein n=1 Tax=Euphydryas editha TaxID=104508 RepID=A0AAU9V7I3_EUPED|nr:unnamed protein product [Euphydryas editha]